jgi:PAS domain S-box-containing protein
VFSFSRPGGILLCTEGRESSERPVIPTRKQGGTVLLGRQAGYRAFFENALEGFFRSTLEGRFLEVNPALVHMLGYASAAEVLALKLPDDLYVDPTQRQWLRATYEAAGVVKGEALLWKKKNGEQIIVSLHARALHGALGRVVGYEGLVVDITERKRIEEALRQSEARYRTVSDLISDYAYAVRIEPDGRTVVEWVTDAFARITGFSVQELEAGGGIIRVIHPEDFPNVLQRLSILLSGQPGISEHRILTKSGEVRWLRDYSCPEWDTSQHRVVRIIGAGQDITERKQAEERLHLLSRQLLEAQESERRHLARELHDEFGQRLTALKINVQALRPVPKRAIPSVFASYKKR